MKTQTQLPALSATTDLQVFKDYHSGLLAFEFDSVLVYEAKSKKALDKQIKRAGSVIGSLSLMLKVLPCAKKENAFKYKVTHFLN